MGPSVLSNYEPEALILSDLVICISINDPWTRWSFFDPYPALWNRNYFLRFRFRSYGFGSNFCESYGYGPSSYFWKVTVPVPVQVPNLDHKSKFKKKIGNFFAFLLSKLFYKEKVFNFNIYIVQCEWKKKCFMLEIKYIILYLVPVFRNRN
jgi:hypothetical protein